MMCFVKYLPQVPMITSQWLHSPVWWRNAVPVLKMWLNSAKFKNQIIGNKINSKKNQWTKKNKNNYKNAFKYHVKKPFVYCLSSRFLFHRDSSAYRQYKMLVDQFKCELNRQGETLYKPEDLYEPEMATDDYYEMKPAQKRKRKSRWGEKETNMPPPAVHDGKRDFKRGPASERVFPGPVMLSKVTRTDPNLLLYVMNTFGSTNLSDEDWIKAEDHYKINLLYQDMLKKREQVERLKSSGKNSYDYDSDEEVDGGTWEHKLRDKEMMATQLWAQELTRQAEGKHHIGDFLPPDEFKRFMEKSSAAKDGRQLNFSDYKEFKIKEDNIGFKMLQKLGWNEGQGLGTNNAGIVEPVNK